MVLHEFAHGLGFLSTVDLATGAKFNGFNDPYIFNLEDHTSGKLYPNMTDAERLAASLNTGNLHWVGTNATNHATHLLAGRDPASGHLRMYAPATSEPGSSVSHWDTEFSPDELMEPFANPLTDRRLTEELFRDIGWTVLPPIQTNGFTLQSESCPNGAIDPGETVTISFGLKNAGFANVANITATLLATNGVSAPDGPQSFGALTNLGSGAARTFTFTANGACGAVIAPTFHVQDGATDYGLVSFSLRLGAAREFTNATAISIPNNGAATPYPSAITVSNFPGQVNGVTVRLSGLSHNNPDDLDVLLVGPGGQKVLLMSDCGGSPNVSGVTFTFSDAAPGLLADSSQLASGTFKPSNYGTGDTFNAPAPAAPYAASLSVFDGTDPNGTWQLFVMDDANPTSGSIAAGWTLILPQCCQPLTNTNPQLAFAAGVAGYVEQAPPLALAPDAVLNDAENTNLLGGGLTVAFATNGTTADQLAVLNAGGITVTDGAAAFNGLAFATLLGGTNGGALNATFTSTNATPAAAQALARAVAFANFSDTPATNTRAVRFTITDGAGGTGAATKFVAVTAVNDPPSLSAVADAVIPEDTVAGPVAFLIGDAESAASTLTVTGVSSNAALLASMTFGGSGSNRTVTLRPATNQHGATLVTLLVSDGTATNSASFLLTVLPVNDAPLISSVPPVVISGHGDSGPIPFTVSDVETSAEALVVTATSSNPALVPGENVLFSGSGSNRVVTVFPATNQIGSAWITIEVSDGEATNSTSFLATVLPPVAEVSVSGTISREGGQLLVSLFVTNAGPDAASAVLLSNVFSASASVTSLWSGAASCSDTDGVVVCLWPALAAHTSSSVSFALVPAQPGWFTNYVSLRAAEFDSDLSNNVIELTARAAGPGDFDGDGLPDDWELAHGTDPLVPDAAADPDHDGLNNGQEYLAGTDPQDAGSVLRIVSVGFEPGGGTVALRFLAASNFTYAILATTNLADGPWERLLDVSAPEGGVITVTNLPGGEPARFFRVVTPAP